LAVERGRRLVKVEVRSLGGIDAQSELVRAMAGLPPRWGGCGVATIRVTPRATVQPCVYWPGQGAPLDVLLDLGTEILTEDAFVDARSVPKACSTCDYLPSCRGGCAGRRRLLDQLDQPNPYCPIIRGERRPLRITLAEGRTLAKSDSACTTVVMARSS
jgi:radical SAM protein with 4Fe4S-binding SPASM domain